MNAADGSIRPSRADTPDADHLTRLTDSNRDAAVNAVASSSEFDPIGDENEAIEAAALESLHRAATPPLAEALGLGWLGLGRGRLSIASALPPSAIVINRGFGACAQTASAMAGAYRDRHVTRFFLHPAADAPDLAGKAAEVGLVPARAWQKFQRPRAAPLPRIAPIRIRPVSPGTSAATAAAQLVCAAFDLGPQAEPWLARLGTDPRWHIFLAEIDGQPAGTGALFLTGGVGWIDWDATDPACRGRGIQRALLVHRLRLADALGLPRTHTCTGLPVPGDPQHSFRNILRCGFEVTTARPNWQPAA